MPTCIKVIYTVILPVPQNLSKHCVTFWFIPRTEEIFMIKLVLFIKYPVQIVIVYTLVKQDGNSVLVSKSIKQTWKPQPTSISLGVRVVPLNTSCTSRPLLITQYRKITSLTGKIVKLWTMITTSSLDGSEKLFTSKRMELIA